MDIPGIARKLEGLQTIDSIARDLHVHRKTAINHAWRLRRGGYLENVQGGRVKLYRISPLIKKKAGYSFYELLNENSRVKIAVKEDYIIHADKKPSVEEVVARAAASRRFRVVLASLGLFN